MKKTTAKNNVHIIFLIYWVVLVAWQNLSAVTNRSGLDLFIKVGLLGMLTIYILTHNRIALGKPLIIWICLCGCLLITFISKETWSFGVLVSYVFPILFVFLTLVVGGEFTIDKEQLITFLHVVIAIVFYMAAYAIVFFTDQFASAFSITSAYGNELSSFLISSHEYGLYLVGGITSCLICLYFKQLDSLKAKVPYIVSLVLFVPNLILTFSRTSLVGMACVIIAFILLGKSGKLKRTMLLFVSVFALCMIFIPALRIFFYSIVFKGNASAGRDVLFSMAIDYYDEGSLVEKLWGQGITESRQYFERETSHGSVHNAYLQILLYFGVIVLMLLFAFFLAQFYSDFKMLRTDRFWGAIFFGIHLMCVAVMMTNTAFLFNSSIDSYFLTIFTIVVPKYVRNAICSGVFETAQEK